MAGISLSPWSPYQLLHYLLHSEMTGSWLVLIIYYVEKKERAPASSAAFFFSNLFQRNVGIFSNTIEPPAYKKINISPDNRGHCGGQKRPGRRSSFCLFACLFQTTKKHFVQQKNGPRLSIRKIDRTDINWFLQSFYLQSTLLTLLLRRFKVGNT